MIINTKDTKGFDRYEDVYTEYVPNALKEFKQINKNTFQFDSHNGASLQIIVFSENITQIRYIHKGNFSDNFSYAVTQLPDNDIKPVFDINKSILTISKRLKCNINSENLTLEFEKDGKTLSTDIVPFYCKETILKGITEVKISKKHQTNERFFGLGDKSASLNMRGKRFQNWCTDAFAYNETTDPLYKAIPFYIGIHDEGCYGIFLDNTYRSFFDFDSKKEGIVSFSAAGGEMRYYFITGETPLEVVKNYTQLTGTPALPPLWALGYHQCRWSYFPEDRVVELANQFRENKIPCDAIYLDIDYMDGYRCFTWNSDFFPNPKRLTAKLAKHGFQTIVMIDPGIKEDPNYAIYQDGLKNDVYCKRPDDEIATGPVWPDFCVFPDYTKATVRDWWGELYRELYEEQGISGFWNDMNEPAVFKVKNMTFPNDIRHDFDGHPCSHAKAHNIYGLLMARSSWEGLRKIKPEKRPFLLTRAIFSGGQRYAAVWTGDNSATWDDLQLANIQCQRLSISGFSFCGSDVGGFAGNPDAELYVRWLQLAVFHPLMRVHYMGNHEDGASLVDEETLSKSEQENRLDREPWSFDAATLTLAREAIELRYRFLPYLYAHFVNGVCNGEPILRPLAMCYTNDIKLIDTERDFMFGESVLVSPVVKPEKKFQYLYLPEGNWYNYWTGDVFQGKRTIKLALQANQIPLFVKAGHLLPHFPVIQHSGEIVETLIIKTYIPTDIKEGDFELKIPNDNGEGWDSVNASHFITEFKENKWRIKLMGDVCKYPTIRWELYGLKKENNSIYVDGNLISILKSKNGDIFETDHNCKEIVIEIG